MLFTEGNMDVVYDFYGNRSTFEYEFEYEYEYVAVFMDIAGRSCGGPTLSRRGCYIPFGPLYHGLTTQTNVYRR